MKDATTRHPLPRYLTPREVAEVFRVNPKTVTRWAEQGRLPYIKTVGGHHRFLEAHVRELLTP